MGMKIENLLLLIHNSVFFKALYIYLWHIYILLYISLRFFSCSWKLVDIYTYRYMYIYLYKKALSGKKKQRRYYLLLLSYSNFMQKGKRMRKISNCSILFLFLNFMYFSFSTFTRYIRSTALYSKSLQCKVL